MTTASHWLAPLVLCSALLCLSLLVSAGHLAAAEPDATGPEQGPACTERGESVLPDPTDSGPVPKNLGLEEPWARTLAVGIGASVGFGAFTERWHDGGTVGNATLVSPLRLRGSWLAATWLAVELETGYSHGQIGEFIPTLATSLGFRFGRMRVPGELLSVLISAGYDIGQVQAYDWHIEQDFWAPASGYRAGLNLGVRLFADRRSTLTGWIGGEVGMISSDEAYDRGAFGFSAWAAGVVGMAWDWWLW